ncbi:MAG: metabolite traffic protein EboE [Granulosicoccus sp.]
MILDCAGVSSHLSYCTNIHAGDAWGDVLPELQRQLPKVRNAMDYDKPMGLGLRLSRNSVDSLQDPDTFAQFQSWLSENNHYVFTINGFPYGVFHGERVKEDVYKPDWTEDARLDYTCILADTLVKLSPPDNYGSISTLPGTYKDWMMPGSQQRISQNLIKAVAHCVRLQQESGVTIALALEPEPCCMLETVSESIAFFKQYLFSKEAVESLARQTGLSNSAADSAMHTHIGICYDVCHSAVEFENPSHAIARLQSAGIEIIKIQLSSALEIPSVNEASIRQLSRFDEPVYLHQVVEQRDDQLVRYNDVNAAISSLRHRIDSRSTLDPCLRLAMSGDFGSAARQLFSPITEAEPIWRVHFHVPVFIEHTEHFSTTQSTLQQVLQLQKISGFCRHLEVETYTWDVLPETYRTQSVSDAIAREVNWVRERL